VARLLAGIRARVPLAANGEITLEANPGTVDAGHFAAYREAGVNRLSIGVQSLSADMLRRLGRIHGPEEARAAVALARSAGFDNLNLDLMYALPGQSLGKARHDLEQALELETPHVSYYQLTLEPNTAFYADPPPLPGDDLGADMHQQGVELLASAGLDRYEVSAYARAGRRCRHNLNYWTFGDYLGIGAGAHGKLTRPSTGQVERRAKRRHPAAYLEPANRMRLTASRRALDDADLVLEWAMNALRLVDGFPRVLFERHTGLPYARIAEIVASACDDGLLAVEGERIRPTELGLRFLNDLVGRFSGE
jgi:oxygen-independent coproporphyrinogen-3 oxidase